jgi:hypothetical protein
MLRIVDSVDDVMLIFDCFILSLGILVCHSIFCSLASWRLIFLALTGRRDESKGDRDTGHS